MMNVLAREVLAIRTPEDIVFARQAARSWAVKSGFLLVDQTKIVTAVSELARNALVHGGGGEMRIERVMQGSRQGLHIEFVDQGPGIADLGLALTDGYTTGGGMGLGLSGSKRLMNEFAIESAVGRGTKVAVTKWR